MVGFAWDSADSRKFLETFRWHRQDFGRLLDLKHTATSFGYPRSLGLGALASHVLGFQLPKCSMVRFVLTRSPNTPLPSSPPLPSVMLQTDHNEADLADDGCCVMAAAAAQVSLSDWEAPSLSSEQIKYAAMDAFITGHLMRCLGLWHSSPSPCPGCKSLLGLPIEQLRPKDLICREPSCRKSFTTPEAMAHHSKAKQHPGRVFSCELCGRWAPVAAAAAPPAAAVVPNAVAAAATVVEVCCSGGNRTAGGGGIRVGA